MDRNNKKLYLCDPNKNIECTKTDCGHLGTGKCFCTTKKEFMADGYLIEIKTNQDKLAEMVRTMDPKVLAKMIFEGHFETIIHCENCPAKDYCDKRMYYDENNPEFVTCEMVMNEWLIKEET